MSSQSPTFAVLGQVARYTETLARDPKSTVFVALAETFRRCGLLQEACAVAEKGIQTLPDHAPGYVVLARIQAQQGHIPAAMASFEAGLALDSSNADALKGLARLCHLQGNSSRSRTLLEKLLALTPDDQVASKMLAALPTDPVPPPVVPSSSVSVAQAAESAPVESRPLRSARSATNPNAPISTATIAEIYVRQGFTLRALKVYRDLLQADPHNEEIRRKLVELKTRIEAEEGKESVIPEPPVQESGRFPGSEPAEVLGVTPAAEATVAVGALGQLEKWLVAIEQRRGHV